jgi:hypothetical protein
MRIIDMIPRMISYKLTALNRLQKLVVEITRKSGPFLQPLVKPDLQ